MALGNWDEERKTPQGILKLLVNKQRGYNKATAFSFETFSQASQAICNFVLF